MPSKTYSYNKAIENICALDKFGSVLGLGRITAILRASGNPEKRLRVVLVGGSNGKGSTVEMLGGILFAQGYKVGTYFSPQIEEFPERFRVNGKNVSKNEIAAAYSEVKEACSSNSIPATFFEVVTAMAFLIFAQRNVDFAVLEVGLGGRLDAVNAAEPEISCITSISLEHTDVLGRTIGKIAHEKCGIARKGRKLICGFVSDGAKGAVMRECKKIGASPIFTGEKIRVSNVRKHNGRGGYSFKAGYKGAHYSVSLSAPGKFQLSNACVALAAASELGCKKGAIGKGLKNAMPKYRFQRLSSLPSVFADCAHNPEAAKALADEIAGMRGKKVLLFSAMKDKDYGTVLGELAVHFDSVVITGVKLARGESLKKIAAAARKAGFAKILAVPGSKAALRKSKSIAGKNGTVVVAGSIYLLADLFGRDKRRLGQ